MFQHTAGQSLLRGGWLTQSVVLTLIVLAASPARGQEVVRVATHLGPGEAQQVRRNSDLQWKQRELTPAKTPPKTDAPDATSTRGGGASQGTARPRSAEREAAPRDEDTSSHDHSAEPASGASQRSNPPPTRAHSWRGTLVRNPSRAEGGPAYAVIDDHGLKRRYLRTGAEVDLERFVDREVTVLSDTGLILDLDQIELSGGSPPRSRVDRLALESEPRRLDRQVDVADYEEAAPTFRPGSPPAAGALAATPRGAAPQDASQVDVQAGPTERIAQRIEPLTLTTPAGQPIITGDNIILPPFGARGGVCPACGRPHGPTGCICGARGTWWGRAEFLYWWPNGFEVPPLVTTSPQGTPQAQAGVLGEPTTTILFGDREVLDEAFNGVRLSGGRWLHGADKIGVEGDYLGLMQESFRYSIFGNNGSPIIARPFFNVLTGAEDASLVAFPNLIEGTAIVEGASDLEMAGLRLRIAACCSDLPTFGNATSRVDFLGGYRFAQLDEQLYIREDSVSIDPENPGSFLVQDTFLTHNEFHGGEAGVVWEFDRPRWALELVGRIAIGSNQQDVVINGSTTVSDNGFSLTQPGGILAQRTNSGHFERNRLSVIPELSATVSFKVTRRLRLTAGYTFLYWSRVVRPGDQIDLDVNPNLFPPEVMPFAGALRPRFAWRESDFWAHGVSAGVDYRF
jgi:hypothetical protein